MCADGDRMTRIDRGDLLSYQYIAGVVESLSPVFCGDSDAEQAQLGHLLDILPWKSALLIALPGYWHDLGLCELSDLCSQFLVFFTEVQIHLASIGGDDRSFSS